MKKKVLKLLDRLEAASARGQTVIAARLIRQLAAMGIQLRAN